MKKVGLVLLLISISSFLFFPKVMSNDKDPDLEDKIALSNMGNSTRAAGTSRMMGMFSIQSAPVQPEVEAYTSNNVVVISVQNYRGGAWVEIYGAKGAKQTYIEVYDMGFDVISLSGLGAGEYDIRISLETDVFTGTFNKGKHGHRK